MTSQADLERAWQACATCVVVGSAVDRNPAILGELTRSIRTPQQG